MTPPASVPDNAFLTRPLPSLYLGTAAPIVFVMGMNGLLTVVDAYFLGEFVGADALSAVTLMFPAYMLLVSAATIVAGGMASILARLLGAGDLRRARETFVSAHALSLVVGGVFIVIFAITGEHYTAWVAKGSKPLATMGHSYIALLVYCSPVAFFLSVNSDALRCEGRLGFMAAISLATSVANIALNYLLIVMLDHGVAGSAIGTVLAQLFAFASVAVFRLTGNTPLNIRSLSLRGWNSRWTRFLALGAPQSLNFLGISLGSAVIISMLQVWGSGNYAATVAAYGIITRLMTFAFLPLLGLGMAMQTITGNNYGAGLWHRSNASLGIAAMLSLLYCGGVQLLFLATRAELGFVFVDDPAPVAEIAHILPIMTLMFFLAGPLLVLSSYFQAIGDAGRAALLGLSRTYLFAIPLTFILPRIFGEIGIWMASPVAEILLLVLTLGVLVHGHVEGRLRLGMFSRIA